MSKVATSSLVHGFGGAVRRPSGVFLRARRVLSAAVDTLVVWQQRSFERTRLAEMDARLLKDVGMTRADAVYEVMKPFWRA